MTAEDYATYPDSLQVREVHVRIDTPGFRTKEVFVVTDLLDSVQYSKNDLAALFRRRWQIDEYHKIMKTGCSLEERALRTAERLEPLIALISVIGTRLLQLKIVGRNQPVRLNIERTAGMHHVGQLPQLMRNR